MRQFVYWSDAWFLSHVRDAPHSACYLTRPYLSRLDDGRFRKSSTPCLVGQDGSKINRVNVLSIECSKCSGAKAAIYAMLGEVVVIPLGWKYAATEEAARDVVEVGVHLAAITPSLAHAYIQINRYMRGRSMAVLTPEERSVHKQYKDQVASETLRAGTLLRSQGWDIHPRDGESKVVPIDDLEMFFTDEHGIEEFFR